MYPLELSSKWILQQMTCIDVDGMLIFVIEVSGLYVYKYIVGVSVMAYLDNEWIFDGTLYYD
jgi:hypothetical protein